MSIDQELLQDFLVEAGELFEQLNDQFVELEQATNDIDLINAIFRAFHTIKGGAGFMSLIPMVEVCHRAEDAINQLRQGEREVTDELVDVMFQVLDELEVMFDCVRNAEDLPDADPELLQKLDNLLSNKTASSDATPTDESTIENATVEPVAATSSESVEDDMDDEFDAMLNGSEQTNKESNNAKSEGESDLITDDEFEALLDDLHGEGKHSSLPETKEPKKDSGLITDEEFEAALDQMHGKGKGPGSKVENITGDDMPNATAANESNSVSEPPVATQAAAVNEPATAVESTKDKKPARAKAAEKPQGDTSVRVDTTRLDDIMNLVGELVLVRNRLTTLKHEIKNSDLSDAISTLELVSSELQGSVMKTRMQPIKKVFSRFPRVIRDLARTLKKDINLELSGEDTDLDKSLVEALADPLIHLVRNAADHGIESPEHRFQSGKPRQGTVKLSAKQEGDQILLTVTDDGKGMDHNVLRKKAVEKGMMSEEVAKSLTNKEAYNLIFAAGFSTKSEISDVSGRGVGMDVVKTRINELNGSVEIDSTYGEGSVITIYLPLTLAILPTLMIRLHKYNFAIPLSNVLEAFNMNPDSINVVDGHEVIRVRERPLPIFYLNPWLVNGHEFNGPSETQKVIVVQISSQRFCLVVDDIAGQEEVVIKPLGRILNNTKGFSGATITGDGGIALILDIPSLLLAYASNSAVY